MRRKLFLPISMLMLQVLLAAHIHAQPRAVLDSLYHVADTAKGKKRVEVLNHLLNAWLQSDPAKARTYGEEALELSREIGYAYGISASTNNIGITYELEGRYDVALELYFKALKENEKQGDKSAMADALNNIGIIHHQLDQLDKAAEYWTQSMRLREELGDSAAIAQSLHNLAAVYESQGEYDLAVPAFQRALKIFRVFGHAQGEASCYTNLGTIFQKQGKLDEAFAYLSRGIGIQDSIGDHFNMAASYNNLGSVLLGMEDIEGAIHYMRKSLDAARKMGNAAQEKDALMNLGELMAKAMRFDSAYHYVLGHMKLKDSLMSEERSRQLAELSTKYETEKKERQIREQALELEQANTKNILLTGLVALVMLAGALWWGAQRQRRKARNELEDLKSRFLTNLVHEFRTPITLIRGPIEEALNGVEDPGSRARLEMAQRNTERMGLLINQVLDISRLESGKMPVEESYGDLVLQLAGITEGFARQAAAKGIELRFETGAETCPALTDADKVEKIVSNLISNALKFTEAGGRVEVRLEVGPAPVPQVRIIVKDTGIGIPAGEVQKVFDRFHQAGGSDYREGTGIGLALVKEFSELMGGTVRVNSQPGKGTEFTVTLPLKKRYEAGQATQPPAAGAEDQVMSANAGELLEVLLVEDNPDMREYVHTVLDDGRYLVHESGNGTEGLQRARELVPDIIVLDVMMPGMDGMEVCRRLKEDEVTNHIPVVMLTARSSDENRLAGMELGADAYIGKPFQKRELLVQLDNLVRLRNVIRDKYRQSPVQGASEKPRGLLQTDNAFIQKVIAVVEQHLENERFSVDQLASELHMSRTQLHRKLKAVSGLSASMLIRNIRLEKAIGLLQRHAGNVTEVAYMVGFGSQPYFSKCFHEYFGITPREAVSHRLETFP